MNFSTVPPLPSTGPGDLPCPRDTKLTVIQSLAIASIEDIADRDALRTHGFTISERLAMYDEEEEGWGGLPKHTCERHGLRARFALKNDLPLTKTEIIARVTAKLPPGSKLEDSIQALNRNFGGTEVEDHLTPYHWFRSSFPENTLITEYPLPETLKQAIAVLDSEAHDLFEVANVAQHTAQHTGDGDSPL